MSRDRTRLALLRKLHSLTGIVPAGIFLVAHLVINLAALRGEGAYTDEVRNINSLPGLLYIDLFGVLLPLLFHGVVGLYIALFQTRYNTMTYNLGRNWAFTYQRFSGIALFLFLGWHLWDTTLAKLTGRVQFEGFYQHLGAGMSTDRLYLAFFVIGILAASFHLANGLWGFGLSWGILGSRRAQRRASWFLAAVGVLLFAGWFVVIYHFATGGATVWP